MTLKPNTSVWREIFQLMEENPAVWKAKCVEYKNKSKKNEGWEAMLEKYKEIDPEADLSVLKSKITNIRSVYRRELKKILESFESGDGEDVYVPSLWYFNDLEFLRRQEEASMNASTLDMDEEKIQIKRSRSEMKQELLEQDFVYLEAMTRKEEGGLSHQEEASMSISTLDMDEVKIQTKRPRNEMNQELLEQEFVHLEAIKKKNDNVEDEADVYAKSWAYSYRKMNTEQQLYAKKAIEDILILGQLNRLSLHTVSTS